MQRQYTGTAGRIENAQVAVYLPMRPRRGHALIDRELYLPQSWTDDPARCAAAGIPDGRGFATKPQLARRMIEPGRWTPGCRSPGWPAMRSTAANGPLRGRLEDRASAMCWPWPAITGSPPGPGASARRRSWPPGCPRAWQRLSAGAGAKGHRYYDWAWVTIDRDRPGHRHLLIRRNRRTGELAFYRCYSPAPVTLAALVTVAGLRWTIEENFQAGKGLAGLDEHQVRRWTSWYRWVTLAMLAAAFLTIAAAPEHAPARPSGRSR